MPPFDATDGVLTLPVDGVTIIPDLYPRRRSAAEEDAAIERYRLAIDLLPPIIVARGNVLVDGFHRIEAHRREKRETIQAIDLGEIPDGEIIEEAVRRNATHGRQLSPGDKQRIACDLWLRFEGLNAGEREKKVAALFSVGGSTVREWTKEARKAERERQQARAWDLWLDCWSTREIEAQLGVPKSTVDDWLSEKRNSADFGQPPDSRQEFDLWRFGAATDGGANSYFGRMPPQVVENLLWAYTEPGWTVVDPFAGGGTTIDVGKKMGRRVWASDLKPSNPLLPIHTHDITAGWPKKAPARADFILLDPPYWKQAKGEYSDDAHDLGNMDLAEFDAAWARVIAVCRDHLEPHGMLAFIISPSVDGMRVIDHAFRMHRIAEDAGLIPHRRIIVAYQTQQATGQQVTWARENRQFLKLYRDLVVFRAKD
jgi:DNA modification methylase